MGKVKKRDRKEKARARLTPSGDFGEIVEQFPEGCRNEGRPCRNIVGLGAGIVLAYDKAKGGVLSAPEFAERSALAELRVISELAQWSGCKGPGEGWSCPTGEIMRQVVATAHFGTELTFEMGTFKRAEDREAGSSPGQYL